MDYVKFFHRTPPAASSKGYNNFRSSQTNRENEKKIENVVKHELALSQQKIKIKKKQTLHKK